MERVSGRGPAFAASIAMDWRVMRLNMLYVISVAFVLAWTLYPRQLSALIRRPIALLDANVPGTSAPSTSTTSASTALPTTRTLAAAGAAQRPSAMKGAGSRVQEFRVPAGAILPARLRTAIDSRDTLLNDQVDAVLTEPVTQDGVELIPAGSVLHGTVVQVTAATREAPRGSIALVFSVALHAETRSRATIRTHQVAFEAQTPPELAGTRRADKTPIDVVVPAGSTLRLTLAAPLVVAIPIP